MMFSGIFLAKDYKGLLNSYKEMFSVLRHTGNANQTTLRFHLIPVRMAIIMKTNNKCWQGCREKQTLIYCW
jgi:hypothetical protein